MSVVLVIIFVSRQKLIEEYLRGGGPLRCKLRLEEIYEIKANGAKIRSKCDCNEYEEKSSKFFLNLEKNRFVQSPICKLIIKEKELTE